MKKNLFVVAAVIMGSQLQAQDSTGKILDEAVITANKFEQKQSQTGKVVTVITREQLEKSGGKTVAQVLNEQAGMAITGVYGAAGSVQTVFMRGASSGRTLVLLDGIPVNDPSMINNEFDLNLFSIHDVERIEILRGAQSTLYGSDAIAGAINIITVKKEVNRVVNLKTTTVFGNKKTLRNHVQLYGKKGKLGYTTRFGKISTDGFSSAHDNTGSGGFDKDGYDGHTFNAGVQYQAFPALLFRSFIQYSRYKAAIDAGIFLDDRDYKIRNNFLNTGVGLDFKKGIVNITANYQYGILKRRYLNDSFYVNPGSFAQFERNSYNARTHYAELYGNMAAAKWLTVLAGFDYRSGNMSQDYLSVSPFGPYASSFDDTSVHQYSFYGSLLFTALNKKLNVESGGRINRHSRYGTNATYTFNPSFSISKGLRIFGSIAAGFKAPSIFQVYDAFSGNPDLEAEKSTNYELGVQQSHEKISSRLVYFHRDIKNGIDYNNATFQYFNFIRQTVNGLEVEITARPVQKLNVSANYTLIGGEEKTQSRKSFNDTSYRHLLRRPKHSLNISLGYQFTKALFAGISGRSVSSRYDVGGYMAEDELLDGYFLLNGYAEYKCKTRVKFFADLQNITGKQFFDTRGYNAIPFMISGGVSIQL